MSSWPLKKETLSHPHERVYFFICVFLSLVFWVPLVGGVLYLLTTGWTGVFADILIVCEVGVLILVGWMIHGLLIARLRSDGIQITENQYPDLYTTYRGVSELLGLKQIPEFYILQSGGVLNAFATRHSGRNFVVIYSSMLEMLGPQSPEVKFLIGHELGHILKNHLTKRMFLAPVVLFPLIMEAYHRANEATCDRYGAFAAGDVEGAARGLTVLGAGRVAAYLTPYNFANQHFLHRGFFVSWHELLSNYPTLSKRVALIYGLSDPALARLPARNPLGYLAAFLLNWRLAVYLYVGLVASAVMTSLGSRLTDSFQSMNEQEQSQIVVPATPTPLPTPATDSTTPPVTPTPDGSATPAPTPAATDSTPPMVTPAPDSNATPTPTPAATDTTTPATDPTPTPTPTASN